MTQLETVEKIRASRYTSQECKMLLEATQELVKTGESREFEDVRMIFAFDAIISALAENDRDYYGALVFALEACDTENRIAEIRRRERE